MISDRMKQRLIGISVIIALAVIFVPVLFNLQPTRPLDQATQIPPAPDLSPIEVEEPVVPEVSGDIPDHDEIFSVDGNEGDTAQSVSEETPEDVAEPLEPRELPAKSAEEVTAEPPVDPALTASGLPGAWVIQVGSYSEANTAKQQADRLQKADFKAFHQQGSAEGKTVFRVFVGPYISRQSAENEKKLVDQALGVKSFILSYEP